MISEKEREALMRLTMCAREECIMCKYHKECDFDFQYELATESMNILADALRKTEPITHDDYIESENDYLEARCLNCNNAKACKEKHWDGCVYEPKFLNKAYKMPNGREAIFHYDRNGVGKITLESMDMLMGELIAYQQCIQSRSFWDSKHCDGCRFYDNCPFDSQEDEDEPQAEDKYDPIETADGLVPIG